MPTPSFESADPDLVEEVIAQSDARLQTQLTVALAADQRAMTFAGLLFAGVAVLIGLATAGTAIAVRSSVAELVASGFVVAAAFACWSARPVKWHTAGNYPSSWGEDVVAGRKLSQTRAETAANYEKMLQENEYALQSAAWHMRFSMVIALISALSGVILSIAERL